MKLNDIMSDETGTVTTDWIVVTGFVVSLALSVAAALSPGLETNGTTIVDRATIATSF